MTLDTIDNIPTCLIEMGKYNEALDIYNQVDKIQTDILGNNHPTTLRTKNKIAICLLPRELQSCQMLQILIF